MPALRQTLKMEWRVSCFLLALTVQPVFSAPIIHAPWGALKGISMEGDRGRKMNAYLGVPYAVPPVGERRFKKPEAHPGLKKGQVFEADKIMPACPQAPLLIGRGKETSEDCLMLDVYVPAEDDSTTTTTTKPYAVMVFIHGGGLIYGDAYSYRPSKLVADGKVIVVVMQYRLGVLGFLTSGDDVLPENLGLWDQNLALRWVQDNIGAFGGDPDLVTIFGQSAGSWSVGFHLVMPQSRGLFKRAIMQSGSPQSILNFVDNFDRKAMFKDLADLFDCEGDNSQQVLTCLQQQPIDDFMKKTMKYEMSSPFLSYFFSVVDSKLLPRRPEDLLQDVDFLQESGVGDVDVMIGFNKHEGATILFQILFGQQTADSLHTAQFFRGLLDLCLGFARLGNHTALKKTAEFFYRGAESSSNVCPSLDPVVNMQGDCLTIAGITQWARYLTSAPHSAARYFYVVDHDFAFNEDSLVPGAHHNDELMLLFDVDRGYPEGSAVTAMKKTFISEEEQALSEAVVSLWTTFAKMGNPNTPLQARLMGGEWPQFTTEEEDYLSISLTPRVMSRMGPYRDRVALWNSILPQLDSLLTSRPAPQQAAKDPRLPREDM